MKRNLTPALAAFAAGRTIAPLWVAPNGRAFYPIAGGAPDDGGEGDKGGDAPTGAADKGADKPEAQSGDKGADGALGEGGKKAIEAERIARKAAEDQAKSLKGEFDGFKSALAEALGIKPKEGEKGEDALTAVQQQLAAMQHESSVLKLANEHKITDPKDMEILATAKDADSMKKLAERLAPNKEERDATSRKRPRPDRAQGGDGQSSSRSSAGSVAAVMAERRAAREAKGNTNL